MKVEDFIKVLDSDFYTGVPDSLLKPFCDYLVTTYSGYAKEHIIAANEGNAVGLAAGYYLATGKIPVVYLQNSGVGNIINPVTSLLSEDVYGIPCLFLVGWRGQPGILDEPQHVTMGKASEKLLRAAGVDVFIMSSDTDVFSLRKQLEHWKSELFSKGKSAALLIEKNILKNDNHATYTNNYLLTREEILRVVTENMKDSYFICTTGKASREVFEIRETTSADHAHDLLLVGSMGHASSVALEVAVQKPERQIVCIDGDGALLMHMGAMPVIGYISPVNLIHIVINNGAHESVGGMPTVAQNLDLCGIAKSCGYLIAISASTRDELQRTIKEIRNKQGPIFIEVKSKIGSRNNLGRPTQSPAANMREFMKSISSDIAQNNKV